MRWLIFIIFYILIDIYAFQAFRTFSKSIWLNGVYIALSVGVLAVLIYTLTHLDRSNGITIDEMYVLGWFLVFFVPKLILIVFMFGEDIIRILMGAFSAVSGKESFHLPSRRKFISAIALGIAAVPFASLIYGMYKGKYRYRVLSYELEFDDLCIAEALMLLKK